MTTDPFRLRPSAAVLEPPRRPRVIVASVSLLAVWWIYTLALDAALLADVGGAGNWIALAACTAAVAGVLRGLWRGGATARRVVQWFAAPVAIAFLGGIGSFLLIEPLPQAVRRSGTDPAVVAMLAGSLLAVLALLVSGLLVRTLAARAWCRH